MITQDWTISSAQADIFDNLILMRNDGAAVMIRRQRVVWSVNQRAPAQGKNPAKEQVVIYLSTGDVLTCSGSTEVITDLTKALQYGPAQARASKYQENGGGMSPLPRE